MLLNFFNDAICGSLLVKHFDLCEYLKFQILFRLETVIGKNVKTNQIPESKPQDVSFQIFIYLLHFYP